MDPEFDFLLIQNFRIDKEQSCEVATVALRKFLFSDSIKGNLDCNCWGVSFIAYELNRNNSNESEYLESVPFLRNGFFQDKALFNKYPESAGILVGSIGHFEKNVTSESQVMSSAKKLQKEMSSSSTSTTAPATATANTNGTEQGPLEKDAEIMKIVKDVVEKNFQIYMDRSMVGVFNNKPNHLTGYHNVENTNYKH